MSKIILTGDRPTGRLHVGHYVGSLRRRLELQNSGEYKKTFIMIADAQALTDNIENPEKVGQPLSMPDANQIGNELTYVMNDLKTVNGLYVGSRHITDISHATEEMMQVKEFFGKLDGRVATHGVISLDEAESDAKNAGKLMLLLSELMERIFPEHQVVYAVNTNTENLHIHFIYSICHIM